MGDTNPFVSCPYNPTHRVLQSRIQAHIIKCQKQYGELEICPYNATHRFPKNEIKEHVKNCETRHAVFPINTTQGVTLGALKKPKPVLQIEYITVNDPEYEDWDD